MSTQLHFHTPTQQKEMLDKIDAERKAEFKRTEMQTEHRRKEMLKALDEKKRLEAEEEFRQRREKLRSHEKIHHPASEQQLEDVWEKEDGLERDQFDPRTFFHLHDTNSDKHLDAMEWETLFYKEVCERKKCITCVALGYLYIAVLTSGLCK